MHIRDLDGELEVWAPAKLNLFLEVLGKREDGFHEIETLMCPIALYDTLVFRARSDGALKLTCRWAASSNASSASRLETLPEDRDNTVMRALELLRRGADFHGGASVRLVKRIPAAAGLAGGSSDAAAALLAANQGWNLRLPASELQQIAAEVGSDVPFFLAGGMAVCRGRGERIEPLRNRLAMNFVVVRPPEGLATAKVYRACRPSESPRSAEKLVTALQQGDLGLAGKLLHNQLEPAARGLSDWIGRLGTEFDRLDVLGHQMSGSGTSYFGLCRNWRHASRVARQLEVRGVGSLYAVRSCL
jgi:4-diphosphocytidyl-2-C-methyl-D-erythritol kinase